MQNVSGGRRAGLPVMPTYAGIRKLVQVGYGTHDEPVHGVELAYSRLEVKDAKAFARLMRGKPVAVRYEE